MVGYKSNRQVVSNQIKNELTKYLDDSFKMHYGLSTREVRKLAIDWICNEKLNYCFSELAYHNYGINLSVNFIFEK